MENGKDWKGTVKCHRERTAGSFYQLPDPSGARRRTPADHSQLLQTYLRKCERAVEKIRCWNPQCCQVRS